MIRANSGRKREFFNFNTKSYDQFNKSINNSKTNISF